MSYDSVRGRAVLFGGSSPSADLRDNWEWDGASWHEIPMENIFDPRARSNHAMVFDQEHEATVMFGGFVPGSLYGPLQRDTWKWNGERWEAVPFNGAPSIRLSMAMVYDTSRQVAVLFGGAYYTSPFGDTWEMKDWAWKQKATEGPAPRSDHAMAYDEERRVTVLFGGKAPNKFYGDTWEWDGNFWTKKSETGPRARVGHAMAYDAIRKKTVLFGGSDQTGVYDGKTWEWDGSAWTQLAIDGPTPVIGHTMVFDRLHRNVMLFGGSNAMPYADVWLLGGAPCPADLDGDERVDASDFEIFLSAYETLECVPPAVCASDFNGDGVVDDADFSVFAAAYGEMVCP